MRFILRGWGALHTALGLGQHRAQPVGTGGCATLELPCRGAGPTSTPDGSLCELPDSLLETENMLFLRLLAFPQNAGSTSLPSMPSH